MKNGLEFKIKVKKVFNMNDVNVKNAGLADLVELVDIEPEGNL